VREAPSGFACGGGDASPCDSQLPGLYIHIPFCRTKCPYCDFYSITDSAVVDGFLNALKAEALLYRDTFSRFDSLYLGGGTPSIIDEKGMTDLFAVLRSIFVFSSDTEITIEMNPDDVTKKKLEIYKALGINRISLGVQSLNDKELAFLKRRHTADGARKALDLIRSGGFDNIGIDLINALAGQTEKGWIATLKEALSFEPAHISCYELTINDETPFGKMASKGRLKLPSVEKQRRIFLSTSQFLKERGFIHYEVSNFARGEVYRSRHNLKYWRHTPYLGLGPAAHSFRHGTRWWNVRSVEQYCGALSKNEKPVEGNESLSSEQLELERFFLGFRNLEGVDIKDTLDEPLREAILKMLISEKLIEVHGRKIIPTVEGYLVADRLPLLMYT
jgi:oxygen-independent coproporphyrinogen-3 oxidase